MTDRWTSGHIQGHRNRVSRISDCAPNFWGGGAVLTLLSQCDVDDYLHVQLTRHFLTSEGAGMQDFALKIPQIFPGLYSRAP